MGGVLADFLSEGKDCLLLGVLTNGLLDVPEVRGSSLDAVEGRTLRPGRPPTDGGFLSLPFWDCEGSSWTAVVGRWVEVVDVDMIETALEPVEP